MKDKPVTFEIGLVMAGAVSAGAYTAGVVDYLIEALDTWNQFREAKKNVPTHDLKIRVLTGASAGGMTAAISVAELLNRPFMPEGKVPSNYESLLYQAWVKDIDISHLLQTNDLKESGDIKSLLDSTVIEKIAKKIIDEKLLAEQVKSWGNIPFVDKELRLYLTLSNLRGLPYSFKLAGETGFPYGMTDHSDYQYVQISAETKEHDWIKLRNAAIATGAFPVGLAPRLIERDLNEYKVRIHKDGRAISGLLKLDTSVNKPYNFVAVDGGTLNNEPIELARSLWLRVSDQEKQEINSAAEAEMKEMEKVKEVETEQCPYALILVDPFPDLPDSGENATQEDTALGKIVAPLIGALRAQSLFKMEELLKAGDEHNDHRFLISPIRYTKQNTMAENAIASGFFGGFGGFLSEDFRKHDYYLGRRNCQRFLEKYFAVESSKARELGWNPLAEYEFERAVNVNGNMLKKMFYPIIPLIKGTPAAAAQGENNDWPAYGRDQRKKFKKDLTTRVGALVNKVLPFGWTGRGWVLAAILIPVALVVAGEFVKATKTNLGHIWVGLTNVYLLTFQIILLLGLVVLVTLRIGQRIIQNKITRTVYDMFLSEVKKWGIHIP
jgi:hypothetical protein